MRVGPGGGAPPALALSCLSVSGNARHLLQIGTELYRRLAGLGEHAGKLGRDLHRVVEDYNALVGTLERRVLVTARRMRDLDLTDVPLSPPDVIESTPRPLTAVEVLDDDTGGEADGAAGHVRREAG